MSVFARRANFTFTSASESVCLHESSFRLSSCFCTENLADYIVVSVVFDTTGLSFWLFCPTGQKIAFAKESGIQVKVLSPWKDRKHG